MKQKFLRFVCLVLVFCCISTSALAYTKLTQGSSGSAVKDMQLALNVLGYNLKADGKFGSGTKTAVEHFQRSHGLTVDGVAGNQTLTLLYALAENASATPAPVATPRPTAAPSYSGTYAKLQQGDQGTEVVKMQQALQKLGYSLTADGKFGSGTANIVKSFQRTYGLTVDGVAGNQTLTLLYALAEKASATPTPVPTPRPTAAPSYSGTYAKLQQGDQGTEVVKMQQALQKLGYSLTADGKFGSGTANIVKSFQRAHGLTVDGVAGSETLSLLYALANAPTATPVPTQRPSATVPVSSSTLLARITTTSGSLNLRNTPGGSVLTTIPQNTIVTVTSRGSEWCGVTYEGRSGYVMTRYLTFITSAPTSAPTPTATPSYGNTTPAIGAAIVSTSGGSLNLRATASDSASVLAKIPNATVLQLYNKGSAWCKVSYQGVTGYVMTKYLTIMNAATQAPATPTPTPTAKPSASIGAAMVTTSGGTLNLRSSASSDAPILYEIPNTAVVQLLSKGSTWCTVSYQGITGYVMTRYLTILQSGSSSSPTPTPTPRPTLNPGNTLGVAIVSTSGGTLNFRSAPSDSASVMMQIPNSAAVQLLTKGDTWCMISYNGTEGYVMTKFLTIFGSGTVTPTQTPSVSVPDEEENDPSKYTRTLRSGMYGEDVRWVQERLKELKYTVNVTGTYDSATVEAVKFFQSQNSLTSDGLAGAQTFAMLKSSNARTANDAPLSYTTLRIDNASQAVRNMQNRLKALGYPLTVNGEYDCDTHNAVVAFQVRNDLVISGIADALTQQIIYSDNAKSYATPVKELPADAGKISGPALSQVQLLHWFNDIKPTISSGQTVLVYDPVTSLSFDIKLYSLGRHADSQPASWEDTQIMNRALGKSDWTCHPVYVMLPDGRWTLASMHNRPHLYGSINNNGFGGHLCIHFLRDMDECKKNDPSYGVQNQNTIRNTWKALTGITVN